MESLRRADSEPVLEMLRFRTKALRCAPGSSLTVFGQGQVAGAAGQAAVSRADSIRQTAAATWLTSSGSGP